MARGQGPGREGCQTEQEDDIPRTPRPCGSGKGEDFFRFVFVRQTVFPGLRVAVAGAKVTSFGVFL